MRKVKLVQSQLDAFCKTVVETNTIGEFATEERAMVFLAQRGYAFDTVRQAWIHGNVFQFPVSIEKPKEFDLSDIRSFI